MRSYKEILLRSFSQRYAHHKDVWTEEKALEECTAFFFSTSFPKPNDEVLDVGTGRGRDVRAYAMQGCRVTGIDLVAVPEWESLEANFEDKVNFKESDIYDFRTDAKFEYVVDNGCFHHQSPEKYSSYLSKVSQLLKLDGKYCLSVFTPDGDEAVGKTSVMDEGRLGKYFSLAEIITLLEKAGFEIMASRKIFRPLFNCYYLALVARKRNEK